MLQPRIYIYLRYPLQGKNLCLMVASTDNDRQFKLCISLGALDSYLITFADV
jgi:hypothetical protein